MKVLWVTNQPIAKLREMLNLPIGQSGGWMETAFASIKDSIDLKLAIAAIYNGNNLLHEVGNGHHFYAVPSRQQIGNYDYKDEFNQSSWHKVVDDFNPDVIQLWGTEYPLGLCVQTVAPEVPSVVYMQGQMSMIANHYLDGISEKEQRSTATLYERIKHKCLWNQKEKYEKSALLEKQILQNADSVIVESNWCGGICRQIAHQLKIYKSALPINPLFSSYDWKYEEAEPHSVFTVSGGYPVKGHHILFRALALIKKKYPNVKLYIPGDSRLMRKLSLKERIQLSSYDIILQKLITKYDLQNNIIMLGRLTPDEMAKKLAKCHVFVMPSMIENHSSSLIEAMMVGVPTVSSFVGGINSYYKDGVNGFFYRADEPEYLSYLIQRYFEDRGLCERISAIGKDEQRALRGAIDLQSDFLNIYKRIIDKV